MRAWWILVVTAGCGRSSSPPARSGDGARPIDKPADAAAAPAQLAPACADLRLGMSRDDVEAQLTIWGIAFRDDELRAYYEPAPGEALVHTNDAAVAFECDGWKIRADIDDTDRSTLTGVRLESPELSAADADQLEADYRAVHGASLSVHRADAEGGRVRLTIWRAQ
jgi:hypothetical protein